jgi:preprotein translocase subunit SecB
MTMTEKYKILAEFVKDISGETPDIETYLFVKDNLDKYHMNISINSKAIKDKLIEVNTTLKLEDKTSNEKKSYFEVIYSTIVKITEDIDDKKVLEKIILCDVQNKVYPNMKSALLNLVHNSGYPTLKIEKQIDFEELYKKQMN